MRTTEDLIGSFRNFVCPRVCQMTHYKEGDLNQSAVGNKGLFREVDGWGVGWLGRLATKRVQRQI